MNKNLRLIESVYCKEKTTFEEILQKSLENYIKNIYSVSRQTIKSLVKYD